MAERRERYLLPARVFFAIIFGQKGSLVSAQETMNLTDWKPAIALIVLAGSRNVLSATQWPCEQATIHQQQTAVDIFSPFFFQLACFSYFNNSSRDPHSGGDPQSTEPKSKFLWNAIFLGGNE
jgi:hypothetical protein